MSEDFSGAVHLAVLEKAHRQTVEAVMQSDMGDVERVVKVLALEAECLGALEKLRASREAVPTVSSTRAVDSRVADVAHGQPLSQ